MTETEIAELGDMLRRLRAADTGFRVFGSKSHRYRIGPTLSESELAAFERANNVRLPEDYRRFLTTVGNGGAGPCYGLEPLATLDSDLARPFPFTKATDALSAEEKGELEKLRRRLSDLDEYRSPGVLQICHYGCGISFYLVVNGPTYGSIWSGWGYDDFHPTGETFGPWYRGWLEHALRCLDNEQRLVPRLRVGMSMDEVRAEVGGSWKATTAPRGRYLSADIPATLEVDGRDVVVKVEPWFFI